MDEGETRKEEGGAGMCVCVCELRILAPWTGLMV